MKLDGEVNIMRYVAYGTQRGGGFGLPLSFYCYGDLGSRQQMLNNGRSSWNPF